MMIHHFSLTMDYWILVVVEQAEEINLVMEANLLK